MYMNQYEYRPVDLSALKPVLGLAWEHNAEWQITQAINDFSKRSYYRGR